MTFLRSSEPGRRRDRERVIATLRRELLVPVDDDVAARHLEAMLLEFDWDLEPAPSVVRPPRRAPKVIAACGIAAALSLTSGFAAAGALPAPAQEWLSRATRFIGIPVPGAPRAPSTPVPSRAPTPRRVSPRSNPVPRASEARSRAPKPLPQSAVSDIVARYATPAAVVTTVPRTPKSLPDGPASKPVASPPAEQSGAPAEQPDGGAGSGDNGGVGDVSHAEQSRDKGGENEPGTAPKPEKPAPSEKAKEITKKGAAGAAGNDAIDTAVSDR